MLRIGWAEREFTPNRPAMLQGQMHTRIARRALDPLTVSAMAVEAEDGSDGAVIVSCDVAFIPNALWAETRRRLAARLPSFPLDRLVMASTHAHTSLVMDDIWYAHPGGDVMTAAECRDLVAEKAAEAAAAAWEARTPRAFGRAFGHAVVGHNRLVLYADGRIQMYGKTHREDFAAIAGYEDHSLDMLFTWEPGGALAGVALAIPCPSQATEHLEEFSADFWHDIRVELRRRLGQGLFVLPLCAPSGDQSPHALLYAAQEKEMRERRGLTERQEIAQRVADAVERALACARPDPASGSPVLHRVRRMELPPWRVTKEERDWAFARREEWIARQGEAQSWWPVRLQGVVDQYEGRVKPPPFPVELHFLRLGDMAVATNPFELFLDYSLQIKARSPAAQTVLAQIAGEGMYLPSSRAVGRGGYGAMPAVAYVGPEGGDLLVRETLAQIGGLFP